MRKFLAMNVNCTLNMYFPHPRLKRRSPETAVLPFFEGHGLKPRLEQK
jgi:hypothetical protein